MPATKSVWDVQCRSWWVVSLLVVLCGLLVVGGREGGTYIFIPDDHVESLAVLLALLGRRHAADLDVQLSLWLCLAVSVCLAKVVLY